MSVEIDTDAGEVRKAGKIRQSGTSTVITLPPEILAQAHLSEGDSVGITADSGSIELDPAGEDTTRTLRTAGRQSNPSVVVTLPPKVLDAAGLGDGTKVALTVPFSGRTVTLQQEGEEC